MKKLCWVFPLLIVFPLYAQEDTRPESQKRPIAQSPDTQAATPEEGRDVSLNPEKFAENFFSDQKMIYTFPAKVVTGHHLLPVLAVLGVTAAIVFRRRSRRRPIFPAARFYVLLVQ